MCVSWYVKLQNHKNHPLCLHNGKNGGNGRSSPGNFPTECVCVCVCSKWESLPGGYWWLKLYLTSQHSLVLRQHKIERLIDALCDNTRHSDSPPPYHHARGFLNCDQAFVFGWSNYAAAAARAQLCTTLALMSTVMCRLDCHWDTLAYIAKCIRLCISTK